MTHDPKPPRQPLFWAAVDFRSGYGWGASVASAIVVGDRGCGVCFRGVMVPAERAWLAKALSWAHGFCWERS